MFSIPNEWRNCKSLLHVKRGILTTSGEWIYGSAIGIRPHPDQEAISWPEIPDSVLASAQAGKIKCYKGWPSPNRKIEEPTYQVVLKIFT
ncbi:MAG TPA: hypothetical protein DD761_20140 [Cyanobacteria bacterium UBA11691]|nr:hypothetical protein [Cyanobacteria bacterium UBA11691]